MLNSVLMLGIIAVGVYQYRRYSKTTAQSLKDENKALESAIDALQDRAEIEKSAPKAIYAQAVKYAKK